MLYGQIERELLDGEPWFLSQQTRLPHHQRAISGARTGKTRYLGMAE